MAGAVPGGGRGRGSFRHTLVVRPRHGVSDLERSAVEAARRARGKVRRYCAANRLNRLGTLTYAGEGCHDPIELRSHVGRFFRNLRSGLGGRPIPYVWTPEWHKTGHGLHVHFAVGQFVKKSLIEQAWGRGFVHIKLLGDLGVGATSLDEARKAAGYLSKYVGKAFEEERIPGLHRYEVAEGFQPQVTALYGRTSGEVVRQASFDHGDQPSNVWTSRDIEGWKRPPLIWARWSG